jgi:peptide/nickel transport system substrate-binding protein
MDIGGSVKAVGIVFAMMFASILAGSGFGIAGTQHAGIQAQVPVPPFRIGMLQPISSLNPFTALEDSDYTIFTLIYSTLTSWDQDWNPAPELAVSWRVLSWKAVDDPGTPQDEGANRLWQYDIRQGVTCTDGVPLTAADVAWNLNFNLATNPICWTNTPYIPLNIFDHAEVNTTLPNSVDLFLKVPSVLIDTMSIPIVPEHIFGSMSRQQVLRWDGLPPVGWGPFKFVEYVTGSHVTMVANDQYYFGKPHIETLQFFFYGNDQVMAEALKKGDIDVATFPAAQTYNTLKGFPNIDTAEGADTYAKDIGFNCYPDAPTTGQHPVNPLVRDERVHQALHYATNKQYLLDVIFGGYGDVGAGLVGRVFGRYYYDPGPDTFNFDLDKANETLEAAGYVWNGDVRVAGPGNPFASEGTPLEFDMLVINTNPEDVAMAPYLVGWWGIVGVKVTIVYLDEATMETRIYSKANHEIYLWYWSSIPDPRYILEVQTSAEIWGWSDDFWSNETYDKLFVLQMQQTGEERNATIQEMCRINYLSSPFIWTVDSHSMTAWRTDVWTGWGNVSTHVGYNYGSTYQPNPMLFGVVPISGNQPPMFDAPLNPTYSPIVNTLQTFQVQVSDVDNEMLWVNWTFGDGSPVAHDIVPAGTSATPVTLTQSHTYTVLNPSPGYTMTVTLTDGQSGHEKVSTATVYVIERPDFAPTFTSAVSASLPAPVHNDTVVTWFVNASDAESGGATGFGLRFTWDWGDGTFTVSNHQPTVNNVPVMDLAAHSWSVADTYNVQVWVWDGSELPGHNVSSGIIPYQVKENTPPAAPNIASISGTEGTWIECVASSVDADFDGLRFTWEWDDGSFNVTNQAPSAGQVTSTAFHRWPVTGSPATYPVTVYVDDRTGYTGHNISTTIDASISAVGVNVAPTALRITPPPQPWYVNTDLKFNTSAIDTDGDPLEFYFEFGDGATGVATLPAEVTTRQYVDFTHPYTTVGHYTMTLWVNDSTGPADHNSTATASIDVVANQVPWVLLPSSLTAGYNRTFTATPTQCKDNDSDPLQVWYDWGDGTPMTQGGSAASSYAAGHIYSSLGNKTLTVYVDDGTGLPGHNVSVNAIVKVFEANLKPEVVGVIEKTPSKTSYLPNETITFTIVVRDFEGDNMTLTVEFGDGTKQVVTVLGFPTTPANSNITQNVTHAYAAARTGPYLVNATIKDGMDHSDMSWSVGRTSVQVTAPTPPPPPRGFPLALVAGGIAIAAVIAVGAILLLKRKKKRGVLPPAPKT